MDNLTDIFTSTTTDQVETNSGSLKNTFDAEAVQHELDVQTRVTQTFDTNRQEVKAEINSVIDNAKDIVNNPNATPKQIAEANQKIEDMQHLGVLVDSISGALYSPADNALGTVANTLSPAIVYEIGQHFKAEGTEGSAQHILAQTLVAAVTAHLAGNDELTAGLSAGGAEIIAPKLAEWLYGVDDASELTSEQKNTISAIISLGSAAIGSTTGQTTDVISSSVAGTVAVEDNRLFLRGTTEKKQKILAILQKVTNDKLYTDSRGEVLIDEGYVDKLIESGEISQEDLLLLQELLGGEKLVGTKLIEELINDKHIITMDINNNNKNRGELSGGKYYVHLDPNSVVNALTVDADGTNHIEPIPNYIIAGHEMIHVWDLLYDSPTNNTFDSTPYAHTYNFFGISMTETAKGAEYRAIGIPGFIGTDGFSENALRTEHNLNQRTSYETPRFKNK